MKYDSVICALEKQFDFSECEKEKKVLLHTLKFYYKKRMKVNYNPIEMTFNSCMNRD